MKRKLFASAAMMSTFITAVGVAAAQSPTYTRQVTFGDSLSDGGAYNFAAPPGAGSFTTNPDPVWVEVLAAGLGLELEPASAGGLNFAEGGSRVTATQPPSLFTRKPIADQVTDFLVADSFSAGDFVTIQGGGNDLFALLASQATVDEFIGAANSLAGLTQTLVDTGPGTVLVANVQGIDDFNAALDTALGTLQPNAIYLNIAGLYEEIVVDPGEFGIVNVTDTACTGNSLVCLPANYVTPDANETYLLADSVHPAGIAQRLQGQMALATVIAPGQIGQLVYTGEQFIEGSRRLATDQFRRSGEAGDVSVFGGISTDDLDIGGTTAAPGLQSTLMRFDAGVDYQLSPLVGFGASFSYVLGDAEFAQGLGDVDSDALMVTLHYRGEQDRFRWGAYSSFGQLNFDEIVRNVTLGPAIRQQVGETEASLFGGGLEGGVDLFGDASFIGIIGGVDYTKVDMDAYTEQGPAATSIGFGDQDFEALHVYGGAELTVPLSAGLRPFARVVYRSDVLDNDRMITIRPNGAPMAYTGGAPLADNDYVAYRAGIEWDLPSDAMLEASVEGMTARDDFDELSGGIRVTVPF